MIYLVETIFQNLRGNPNFFEGVNRADLLVSPRSYEVHAEERVRPRTQWGISSKVNHPEDPDEVHDQIIKRMHAEYNKFKNEQLRMMNENELAFDWLHLCLRSIVPGTHLESVIPSLLSSIAQKAYHWIDPEPCAVPAMNVIRARLRGVIAPANMIEFARGEVMNFLDEEMLCTQSLELGVAKTLSFACDGELEGPAKSLCSFIDFRRPSCGYGGTYSDGDMADYAKEVVALIAASGPENEILIDLNYQSA